MTLLDARKTVLKSIAAELNQSYLALYGQLEQGRVLAREAQSFKTTVDELESLMGYVRFEAENLSKESLQAAAKEVENLWQGAQHGR